jgi:serine/threonine protein kinase
VADFGLACIASENELLFHKCGSPGYVAPEIFMDNGYDYKADIFSLGSVFYNLLTGMFLFSGQTV